MRPCDRPRIGAYLSVVVLAILGVSTLARLGLAQEPPVFSGPQAGEKLPAFEMRGVLGPGVGSRYEPVKSDGNGKTTVLIFVHQVTRPSIGLTRSIMDYVRKRSADGATGAVILLTADVTETENWVKRASNALPEGVPVGISTDGVEGPGAYGLNRNVTLTVVVGKGDSVAANFALIQPSLQADGLKIATEISKALGDAAAPTASDLGIGDARSARRMADEDLRSLLQGVIRRTASDEEVDAAAKRVEAVAATNEAVRRRIGEITRRIIEAGRLQDYGTPHCQTYLRKWSQEFGPKADSPEPAGNQQGRGDEKQR